MLKFHWNVFMFHGKNVYFSTTLLTNGLLSWNKTFCRCKYWNCYCQYTKIRCSYSFFCHYNYRCALLKSNNDSGLSGVLWRGRYYISNFGSYKRTR